MTARGWGRAPARAMTAGAVADGGYGFVDVNHLAASIMIDRVEDDYDGLLALYGDGGDAVDGS